MKTLILNYFKTDRSYQGGVTLYMRFGNRMSFRKQLNVQPETIEITQTLHEELRALAGIDSKELQAIMRIPVKKVTDKEETPDPLPLPVPSEKEPEEVQQPIQETETLPLPEKKSTKQHQKPKRNR